MKPLKPNRSNTVLTFVENDHYFKNQAYYKKFIRCSNCKALTTLSIEQYKYDSRKGRYWCCGECGNMIDPDNWRAFK